MESIRTIGLIAHPHKRTATKVADALVLRLSEAGVEVRVFPDLERELITAGDRSNGETGPHPSVTRTDLAACDLVVVLGGDGTLLHAVRILADEAPPLLGVNLGNLGFLTEAAAHELDDVVPRLLAGDFTIVERPLLEARIESEAGTVIDRLVAMNDIVIDEGSPTRRAVRLRIALGETEVGTFTADGIVVATAAGSTAYSLSAGGPILGPGVSAFVATPICPHTMSVRPLVYPDDACLTVEDLRLALHVKVTADGQVWAGVPIGGRVRIARHPARRVRLVSFGRSSYYEVLRAKLRWGSGERGRPGGGC